MPSNTANNLIAGDWHATDVAGSRVQLKTTNNGGVHTLHVIDDPLTPGVSSKVAVGSTSAQSGAILGTIVRLVATTNCHVAFGSNPTAVADGTCMFVPAGIVQLVPVTSGQKLAVIQDLAAGNLFTTVMA